jgi:hypothetical protein
MQRTGCTRLFCDYGDMEMGVAKSGFRFGRMFAIICGQNNRRGAGVVERGGLENRCGLRATVGSNPTLSAERITFRASSPAATLGERMSKC